jgi:hypothetical protein
MNSNDTTTVSSTLASNNTENLMNNTVQNEIANLVVNRINAGERVTILALAKEKNISASEIRNALIDAFGNRVSFRRGRTGGIVLA